MATPQDKYYLRSLHEEIDLFDRKLAHMLKYDTFATEAERTATADKLKAKRVALVRTARQLIEDGIEFKDCELPRSLRTAEITARLLQEETAKAAEAEDSSAIPMAPRERLRPASPFAGTLLDPRADLQAYKKNRTKSDRTHS